jgi:hypothetical protein
VRDDSETEHIAFSVIGFHAGKLIDEYLRSHVSDGPAFLKMVLF